MKPKWPAEAARRPLQPGSEEPPPEPVPGQDDPDPQPKEPTGPSTEEDAQPQLLGPCQPIPTPADTLLADSR